MSIEYLQQSIELSTKSRIPELNGYSKFYLAQSLFEMGETARAIELAKDCLVIFSKMGYWVVSL